MEIKEGYIITNKTAESKKIKKITSGLYGNSAQPIICKKVIFEDDSEYSLEEVELSLKKGYKLTK